MNQIKSAFPVRPLRGRAFLAKDPRESGRETAYRGIIIPATAHNPRETREHRGRVLALGPPARTEDGTSTVPWGCKVGDEVLFVYAVALEKVRTIEMLGIDGEIVVVGQEEVLGVCEP